jgi:hypothetical protein
MPAIPALFCHPTRWNKREAFVLGNGVIRLTALTGGGHIAEFRREQPPSVSPLWVPPWKTIDPQTYREKSHKRIYGTTGEGKLLSGIVGHSLCLDYFGNASAEEIKHGLSQHGEAGWSKWKKTNITQNRQNVALEMAVGLPVAGLNFIRKIQLRRNEPVVYVRETVRNLRKSDHFFHWTQHVTLGPPFLSAGDCSVALPGAQSLTFPHGYDEGRALLVSNRKFSWPLAPAVHGGNADLSRVLLQKGLGFVVTTLLEKRREIGFIACLNRKLNLLLGYCFRRSDFPWVALWEENRAIKAAPWKRRTETRGLEFSTTPLPLARRESFLTGNLFGEPTLTVVPAGASKSVSYCAFLVSVPKGFAEVKDIQVEQEKIVVSGGRGQSCEIPSSPF